MTITIRYSDIRYSIFDIRYSIFNILILIIIIIIIIIILFLQHVGLCKYLRKPTLKQTCIVAGLILRMFTINR